MKLLRSNMLNIRKAYAQKERIYTFLFGVMHHYYNHQKKYICNNTELRYIRYTK